MKKALALLLALVMCLSLAACSSDPSKPTEADSVSTTTSDDSSIDKDALDSYLGVWASENMRFIINKGGVGRYEVHGGHYDFTYEIKYEAISITIFPSFVASFELNDDGTALTILTNGLPTYVEDETVFTKQETE